MWYLREIQQPMMISWKVSIAMVVTWHMPQKSSKDKSPCPYGIPNDIPKAIPKNFHAITYLFLLQCYHGKKSMLHGNTISQYYSTKLKPNYCYQVPTYRLSMYHIQAIHKHINLYTHHNAGTNQHLYHHQEGIHSMRNTIGHIQAIVAAIEDAQFTNQDEYLTYILISKTHLVELTTQACHNGRLRLLKGRHSISRRHIAESTTLLCRTHFTTTPPIQISDGTIQKTH